MPTIPWTIGNATRHRNHSLRAFQIDDTVWHAMTPQLESISYYRTMLERLWLHMYGTMLFIE